MGLTKNSTGLSVAKDEFNSKEFPDCDKVIAVAGNPNVGKSTIFNSLTGLNQHTGNWPGKTVTNARGKYTYNGKEFILVDLPGTYSLNSNSVEEEIARDFICFGGADLVVVVMDSTCLERNLNLALQIKEMTSKIVVCVNILDEAERKGIDIDFDELSMQLGAPVVGTSVKESEGKAALLKKVYDVSIGEEKTYDIKIDYPKVVEDVIDLLEPHVKKIVGSRINSRWVSVKLLDMDKNLNATLTKHLNYDLLNDEVISNILKETKKDFAINDINEEYLRDEIVSSVFKKAENIYRLCVHLKKVNYNEKDRRIDKILTSKLTGIPVMIALLFVIFWITLSGANYPSEIIADALFYIQDKLTLLFNTLGAPEWLHGSLVLGLYRTLAWVVSVMLPPMAIFFPLFTLLEDVGYLPRVAFNLDHFFKKSGAHGKQSLTMCMGFGCNACGVIGCRIIDSQRERLIATITNNFVPCNGRFPTLIAIITIFFAGVVSLPYQSLLSTLILTAVILIGIFMTLLVSKLLSQTILKGVPSSFVLELPPYRRPQVSKVIVRSVFDRTLFVLGRAVLVAAPAGLLIWIMANVFLNKISILSYFSNFLDPFARLIGLDGVILMAFIMGFPANEIVIPIIIMSYLCTGSLTGFSTLEELRLLLVNNGWTWLTAVCTMLFSLMHFPCGTTCLTIKKETGSFKWTVMSFLIPTISGIITCFLLTSIVRLFGLEF
ncbi:MAG: ferrous iron transport protein B [Eubacteriales bacterium SKADARSKE-1]|nr:ferrous iron transport protein B [Eubacteriales bacterium SKADARSKE-1]